MKETKLNGESINIVNENIQQLKQLFPEVFAEESIDFDKLKTVLGEYVDNDEERYNFTWWGKSKALRLAQTPSTGTLRPCPEESKDWDTTENLYIEGDNLEVLKLLQKTYHNKIKMIYIDPPYNTGKDFVYPDNYKDNLGNYLELTGQISEGGQKTSTNSESDGRYHTNWLNMMYPRLRLARNLLMDEGLFFISIDDNEYENLKKICDEVFGEVNFIDNIIWKKRYGGGAKEKYLVSLHEYCLVYAKSKEAIASIEIPLSEESIKQYYKSKDDNHSTRGPYRTHPLEATKSMGDRPNLVFPIEAPDGTQINPKRQWLWSKERVSQALLDNEIEFLKSRDNKWSVHSKQYLRDKNGVMRRGKAFSIIDDVFTQHGTNEIIELFGNAQIFSFPKPTAFIKKLMQIGLSGKNDIILDFFAGSSTTADSLIQANAEDNGDRKFILIQMPEPVDAKTEAYKAGYKNIAEIGLERIRRAGDRIKADLEKSYNAQSQQASFLDADKLVNPDNLDIGFKVFKLDSSNLKKWNPDVDDIDASLFDSIENFVEGRDALDVVYETMLKYGIDLTLPIETFSVGNIKIYSVGLGALMICLDNEITTEVANEIVRLKSELSPEVIRVVFKDNGFKNDSAKTNTKEILRTNGVDEIVSI